MGRKVNDNLVSVPFFFWLWCGSVTIPAGPPAKSQTSSALGSRFPGDAEPPADCRAVQESPDFPGLDSGGRRWCDV